MHADERRSRWLRRIALACALAMLATIALSAYMRLAQAGLGCADWPACYAQAQRDGAAPASASTAIALARLAHRVVASAVLVGAFVLLLTTAAAPVLRRERTLAAALVALALALAALGVVTPGARLPAVTLGNLLGGFAMLAICGRLAAPGTDPAKPGLGGWATAALMLTALQVALGAQVSASHAALSCSGLGDCLHAGGDWHTLSPWREPVFDAVAPVNRAAAPVQLLHRVGAIAAVVAVCAAAAAAWRRGRRGGGVVLIALAMGQAAIGPLIAAVGLPLALVHNAVAALLLASLVRLR
jgi:cytochrome c oxidase assembly protein subunit 15